jgi:hypothetical protein
MLENKEINRAAAHCPNCGADYRAGFDTCADCGVALEPGPAPAAEDEPADDPDREDADAWSEATRRAWSEDAVGDDHPEPVAVARLRLQEAMLLVGRLEEAGIPARVDADVGPYWVADLNMLKAVLVPRSRLAEAERLLQDVRTGREHI